MHVVVQLPSNIFYLFVEKNLRFVGLVSGTNSGPVLDPGVQNEGRYRDQNMDPENPWLRCAIDALTL